MYLIIDKATAEWLLQKKYAFGNILETCESYVKDNELFNSKLIVGPIVAYFSKSDNLIVIINKEVQDLDTQKEWGIVKLSHEYGLLNNPIIRNEVFERSLNIIKARLNNFFIDGSYIHRSYENNAHTCISGRGNNARQQNIAYYEHKNENDRTNYILIIGPEHNFEKIIRAVISENKVMLKNIKEVNSKIEGAFNEYVDKKDGIFRPLYNTFLSSLGLDSDVESAKYQVHTEVQSDNQIHTYEEYISGKLQGIQKKIFESDVLYKSPLRILGPAGSGKTLLMQLLSIKVTKEALSKGSDIKCLYLVHNNEMAKNVRDRFRKLGISKLDKEELTIDISTLYTYAINKLEISYESIVDSDAFEAKEFQHNELKEAIYKVIDKKRKNYERMKFFESLVLSAHNIENYAMLIMNEISNTIKGQGLSANRERYLFSEKPLSKMHSFLNQYDREFVFDIYDQYNDKMFNEYSVLDTDDIAISLLARLKTPLWEMQRKTEGYDFIFVDEAQLFNENERKLFSLLSNKKINTHVPVVIALDVAQDLYSQFSFGMHEMGIKEVTNENLELIHRSSKEIMDLAFFVIQKSTSIFTPDFPNFETYSRSAKMTNPRKDLVPIFLQPDTESEDISKFLFKKVINKQKRDDISNIAVICFGDSYWDQIIAYASKTHSQLDVIETRGALVDNKSVILSKPQFIGGQEFECVILVGLEQGMYPPISNDSIELQSTIEEQCIREMYLAITRAKNRLIIVNNHSSSPNAVIKEAISAKKVKVSEI